MPPRNPPPPAIAPPLNPPPPPPAWKPPPPPNFDCAKLALVVATGNASANAVAMLKTFRLVIFGSISGMLANPPRGRTFPSHAPLVRDGSLSECGCMGDERIALILRRFTRLCRLNRGIAPMGAAGQFVPRM